MEKYRRVDQNVDMVTCRREQIDERRRGIRPRLTQRSTDFGSTPIASARPAWVHPWAAMAARNRSFDLGTFYTQTTTCRAGWCAWTSETGRSTRLSAIPPPQT
ncbi:hypothetical protein Ntsu_17550 [Nocardia sp. IFM 10818]